MIMLSYLNLPIIVYGAVFAVLGLIIGFYLPFLAKKINIYKLKNYDRKYESKYEYKKFIPFITGILLSIFSFLGTLIYPLFTMILVFILLILGITIALVDMKIRIIPNELVLLLFVIGLAFRIKEDGIKGILNSLIALLIVIAILAIASIITYTLKGDIGAGAGDFKLMLAISVVTGFPGLTYFLIGLAISLIAYFIHGIIRKKITLTKTFPMAGPIIVGLIFYLLNTLII